MRKYFGLMARLASVGRMTGLIISKSSSRRAMAIWVAAAMLNLCTTVAFASPAPNSEIPTGITSLGGVVMIDGSPALSGQTLFSGSSIVTATGSESRLDLDNLARLNLYAESKLTLEFSRSTFSGSLEQGTLHAFVPSGVRADIVTTDASVASDPGQAAAFSIQVESGSSTISVESGRVDVRSGNSLRSIAAGEKFSTRYGAPLAPEPQQSGNKRKLVWLFLGIGAAVAVLTVAIIGRDNEPPCNGGAVVPSGSNGGPGVCQ